PPLHGVRAATALEQIIAVVTEQSIVTALAVELVVAAAACERLAGDRAPADDSGGGRNAVQDIGLAGIGAAVVTPICPDDDLGKAIAIDIGGRDVDGEIARFIALDNEAVAVDVAGRSYAAAGEVGHRVALNYESIARGERSQVHDEAAGAIDRTEGARAAQKDIGLARFRGTIVAAIRTDDEIGESVAIDVSGRSDRKTGEIQRLVALHDETVGRREGGEVNRRAAAAVDRADGPGVAVEDIGL